MKNHHGTSAKWLRRIAAGAAGALIWSILWIAGHGIEMETDRFLLWLGAAIAFLIGITEGGGIFMRRRSHDV